LWVRHFETIEEPSQALLTFRETYNATWLIERHGFMSPAEFCQRQLQPVAEAAFASIRCPRNRNRYNRDQLDNVSRITHEKILYLTLKASTY
jgi:hypothetical protein